MQIMTLNTWGGRAGKEKLLSFLGRHADVDIFCFQEVWSASYDHLEGFMAGGRTLKNTNVMVEGLQEISAALSNHEIYFHPHLLNNYGLLTLVKRGLRVRQSGEVYVHKHKGYVPEGDIGRHARNIQYVTLEKESSSFSVVNFHGLWNGEGKGDSPDRIEQSGRILEFLATLTHPFVFCGDFNLNIDTESIRMLEIAGLQNLIRKYGIISTRSPLYDKQGTFYADYMFVSEGVSVDDFTVLPDVVSDHLPLLLEVQ